MDGQLSPGAHEQREPPEPAVQARRHRPPTTREEGELRYMVADRMVGMKGDNPRPLSLSENCSSSAHIVLQSVVGCVVLFY